MHNNIIIGGSFGIIVFVSIVIVIFWYIFKYLPNQKKSNSKKSNTQQVEI